MSERKIAYYFQKLERDVNSDDNIPALIDLHTETFERHGWTVVRVDESDARRHPHYDVFDNPNTILSKSRNAWEYTRACYMRWLAYAVLGYPFADFDVINYGFTPHDADEIKASNVRNLPIFLSAAGAMGLLEGRDYTRMIDTYLKFIKNPVISGSLSVDINDMTIMREMRSNWYNCIAYPDDRFVKDYTIDNWQTAKMVHYAYGLTACPRVETIRKARPLVL